MAKLPYAVARLGKPELIAPKFEGIVIGLELHTSDTPAPPLFFLLLTKIHDVSAHIF